MAREPQRMAEDKRVNSADGPVHRLEPATWQPDAPGEQEDLPLQPGVLFGRARELNIVGSYLQRADARLLTLTGFGGVGKSRLAVQVARQVQKSFEDGVCLVDLSHLTEPDEVIETIAEALDVQGASTELALARLGQYLRSRNLLLVLDNFEHVMQAAPLVDELLAKCPQLMALVTSREPLRSRWEHVMLVSPLAVPDPEHLPPIDELVMIPSVELFVWRARTVRLDFTLTEENARDVAQICVELEGLPLAIQLAAARTNVLTPSAILHRLDTHLSLLHETTREVPARQRSITATIEWSYDLLTIAEQALFRRLSVFVGGFSLEAATAVTAPGNPDEYVLEGITQLVDKSLVLAVPTSGGEPRFALNELLRRYGSNELALSGEQEIMLERHAAYFLRLGERCVAEMDGPLRGLWLNRLTYEHDNIRRALRWARDTSQGDLEIRLAWALSQSSWMRGQVGEGIRVLGEALGRWPDEDPSLRARALDALGAMLRFAGSFDRAQPIRDEVMRLARGLDDPPFLARVTMNLGALLGAKGESDRAQQVLEQALAMWESLDSQWGVAQTLLYLSIGAVVAGQYEQANAYAAESLSLAEHLGITRTQVLDLGVLARTAQLQGNMSLATEWLLEAVRLCCRIDEHRIMAFCLEATISLAANTGRPESVAQLLGASEELHDVTGFARAAFEQQMYSEGLRRLQERMDKETLARERDRGRALSLDQVSKAVLSLLQDLATSGEQEGKTRGAGSDLLSKREQEVLQFVAQGLSNKQIAKRLFISENTVKFHIRSLLNKLGADSRAQVVALAAQRHLLDS